MTPTNHLDEKARLNESPWIVTSRRRVHDRRGCSAARRVAFPMSWLPSVQRPQDHACRSCLGGVLPTQDEVDAPLTVTCSQCGAGVREECRGDGEGYHLSRFDRLEDEAIARGAGGEVSNNEARWAPRTVAHAFGRHTRACRGDVVCLPHIAARANRAPVERSVVNLARAIVTLALVSIAQSVAIVVVATR